MKRFMLAAAAAMLVGGAAQAQFTSTSKPAESVDDVGQAAEIHEVYAEDGMIFVVLERGQAATPLPTSIMADLNEVCAGDRTDMVIEHPALDEEMAVELDDYTVTIGGTATGYECPLPSAVGPHAAQVEETWKMHRGHGEGEFTRADLRTVLAYMRKHPRGEVINRLDVRGSGNDRPYIDEALRVGNSVTGQLIGWQVKGKLVTYYIVTDVCLEICHGSVAIWHLHTKVRSKPKVRNPVVNPLRPMGDAPRLRCGNPC